MFRYGISLCVYECMHAMPLKTHTATTVKQVWGGRGGGRGKRERERRKGSEESEVKLWYWRMYGNCSQLIESY